MDLSVFTQKAGAILVAASVMIAGCATSSKDVSSAYVSPMQYQNFDCDQLAAEAARLQTRVSQIGGRLDEAANNDKVLMGVTLFLFWPAAFALGGTKAQEAEYARLKGEHDAIMQSAIAKKCPGFIPTSVPQPTVGATASPTQSTSPSTASSVQPQSSQPSK